MTRLRELSDAHHFKVVVFAHSGMDKKQREICTTLGIPVIDGLPMRHQYMKRHGIQEYLGSELTISESDEHPSKLQHHLLAELLVDKIEKWGWLEQRQ